MKRSVCKSNCSKKKSGFYKAFSFIRSSWWVFAFCLFTYMLCKQTFTYKQEKLVFLHNQYEELEKKYLEEFARKEQLLAHLESHSDPEFLALVLKKKLGVVPEGQIKVHFKKDGSGIQSYLDEK